MNDEPLLNEDLAGTALTLTVSAEDAGQRLDRFAADKVPDLSRSYARQLIEDNHIRVNGRDARPSTTLRPGDEVTIWRPLAQPTDLVPEEIPLDVVYEDADVVVVDKPAGMVVHPAPGHARGTLVNALLARYPDIAISGDLRPGIVHRLDRDTSGLLVVARNDRALRDLQAQQQARAMTKVYLAVVEGRFKEPEGTIDAPIGRHPTDRTRMAVVSNGRHARTHWRVLEELGDYTLIEARLETGRTHQIRVHFAHKSRPLLGDPLYGPKRPRATFGLTRQFLHAHRLGFRLPSSGEWGEWSSPLPEDLEQALQRLRASVRRR
ncbi:MAG: RluA family pseudouridine synthase [Chloroflexota bacterium]|nr:MAG: RluA family pseudouridine synthase [Chloroflexota bacterium]